MASRIRVRIVAPADGVGGVQALDKKAGDKEGCSEHGLHSMPCIIAGLYTILLFGLCDFDSTANHAVEDSYPLSCGASLAPAVVILPVSHFFP